MNLQLFTMKSEPNVAVRSSYIKTIEFLNVQSLGCCLGQILGCAYMRLQKNQPWSPLFQSLVILSDKLFEFGII